MSPAVLLDVVLVLLLIAYVLYGYRIGLVRSVSAIIGIVAGAIAATIVIPIIATWISDPTLRVIASIVVLFLLLSVGQYAGLLLGGLLGRGVKLVGLRIIDRVLGGIVGGVVAAVVASTLAMTIASLGVPFLTPLIASSAVLRTIETVTPDPAKALLAQLRSVVTQQGLPSIAEALGGPSIAPELPNTSTTSPALDTAAKSVVRIVGNAYACGQSQTGSGFVVSPGRIVTNAHVVAGVSEPVVEVPGVSATQGTVVYFDPVADLAVVAVKGLDVAPLKLTSTLKSGAEAVTDGYPLGGPFQSLPAEVLSVGTSNIDDIYGTESSPREIYTLAADVQQGDSGGPLLSTRGRVAGVVFAKSAKTDNLGYAITMTALKPVVEDAPSLTKSVSSGSCVRD